MRTIVAFVIAYTLMRVSRHVFPCGALAAPIEETLKRFLLRQSPSRYALFGVLETLVSLSALALLQGNPKAIISIALHTGMAKLPLWAAIAAHALINQIGLTSPHLGGLLVVFILAIQAYAWWRDVPVVESKWVL